MQARNVSGFSSFLILAACALQGRAMDGQEGDGAAAEGSRTYRYTCDFLIYDVRGNFQNKMKIQATHTRDLPDGLMRWDQASISFGTTLEGEFTPPMPQTYMDGFSYPEVEIQEMLTSEFFADFPTTPFGFLMKNSVLDAHVFDTFLLELDQLEPNVPHRSATSDAEITLYEDQGVQHLKDLTLTWTGTSERNGRACRVIRYQSSLDSVVVNLPGLEMAGSTVFWGDIWVSSPERQIEYATLYEHSLTGPPDPEASIKDLQNTYRTLTFERVVDGR